MKKALPLPLLILFTILCCSLYNSSLMDRNAERWCGQLQNAALLAQAEEWDLAKAALEESLADWSSRQTYLHIVSTHDAINEAESMYRRALAFTDTRESNDFQAELAGLQAQLRFLAEMEEFNLRNIL